MEFSLRQREGNAASAVGRRRETEEALGMPKQGLGSFPEAEGAALPNRVSLLPARQAAAGDSPFVSSGN